MFIHIGNNIIVSDKKTIGIFNRETLLLSKDNEWIITHVDSRHKTVAIDKNNNIISSKVSPFTVTKRTSWEDDFIWRRKNDEDLQRG